MTARAFLGADTAAFAIIVVELVSFTGTELNNSTVRANTIAVIAFHAVTAG